MNSKWYEHIRIGFYVCNNNEVDSTLFLHHKGNTQKRESLINSKDHICSSSAVAIHASRILPLPPFFLIFLRRTISSSGRHCTWDQTLYLRWCKYHRPTKRQVPSTYRRRSYYLVLYLYTIAYPNCLDGKLPNRRAQVNLVMPIKK